VVTSIVRKRFTEHGKAWRWRAIHYASYVAFVFGVLHGLLGGRTAKPYVDWSYGFAIAVTALGLAVRFLAISLRPKESLPSSPAPTGLGPPGRRRCTPRPWAGAGPAGRRYRRRGSGAAKYLGGQGAPDSWAALPAPGWSAAPARCPPWAPPRPTPDRPRTTTATSVSCHWERRRTATMARPGCGLVPMCPRIRRARRRPGPPGSRSMSLGTTDRPGSRARRGDTAIYPRTSCPPTRTDRGTAGPPRRTQRTTRTVRDPARGASGQV
jgi:hypothetical protein